MRYSEHESFEQNNNICITLLKVSDLYFLTSPASDSMLKMMAYATPPKKTLPFSQTAMYNFRAEISPV